MAALRHLYRRSGTKKGLFFGTGIRRYWQIHYEPRTQFPNQLRGHVTLQLDGGSSTVGV
jgi:hypothetical protein